MTEELKPSWKDRGPEQDQTRKPELQTASRKEAQRPDPTRYGDWEKEGRCIDF
ncbi:DUF1674 domain-containing protein [Methylocaldum sp. MU1018]